MTEDELTRVRAMMASEINAKALGRDALETAYGQTWDTEQLGKDFEVLGFLAPFCIVSRRADGRRGSLIFQHHPRYYWGFDPEKEGDVL